MIENLDAYRRAFVDQQTEEAPDEFLIREGLDVLAAFRNVKSGDARIAVIALINSIVEAERQAGSPSG